MRSFFTFLSLFTLLFFLAPILCLGISDESEEQLPPLQIPEQILQKGERVATADLILGALGAMDVRGYHSEALKAAAVVAATQVVKHYKETGCGDGIETVTAQQAKEAWGDYWFSQYWPQMQTAVRETWGEILTTANGDAFEASVFRLSWGETENGVECPLDETAEGYESTVRVPLEEFVEVFPEYASSFSVKNAQSGRVETVTSGKTKLSGSEVMQRFSLPSPAFTVSITATAATFRCRGQGDGVGMSLYGANERAKQGADYREILKEFYPDARLQETNRGLGSK